MPKPPPAPKRKPLNLAPAPIPSLREPEPKPQPPEPLPPAPESLPPMSEPESFSDTQSSLSESGSESGAPNSAPIYAEHLASIDAPAEAAPAPADPNARPEAGVMSKAEFRERFIGVFQVGGLRFKALKIDRDNAGELARAQAAADALYDTAREVEFMGFLLRPGNKWAERGFCLYMFAAPKMQALRAEIIAERIARAAPKPAPRQGGLETPPPAKTSPPPEAPPVGQGVDWIPAGEA